MPMRTHYCGDVNERLVGSTVSVAGWVHRRRDHGGVIFGDLRDRSDERLHDARRAQAVLWVNHLVAAVDALRAARIHNLPLRDNLGIKARGGWRHGGPSLAISLEGKF